GSRPSVPRRRGHALNKMGAVEGLPNSPALGDASAEPGRHSRTAQPTRGGGTMPKIRRIQHAVLNVRDLETSIKFYTEALGMEAISDEPQRKAAFLTFGGEHHNIALFQWAKNTDPVNADHVGFNHLAFEVEGGDAELKALHDHFVAKGVKIDRMSD